MLLLQGGAQGTGWFQAIIFMRSGNAVACNYRNENGKMRALSFRHKIALTIFDAKRKPT